MDAKLLRVEMLEIMGLLDNLQANWPDDAPPIPYIKAFRLRLAKATLRNLCLKEKYIKRPVAMRLPRAETLATAKILLQLAAEQPATLGIHDPDQLINAFRVICKILPPKQGKREQKQPTGFNTLLVGDFHPTTKWRRKKREKAAASGSASARLKTA